jgi:hypothetical protein
MPSGRRSRASRARSSDRSGHWVSHVIHFGVAGPYSLVVNPNPFHDLFAGVDALDAHYIAIDFLSPIVILGRVQVRQSHRFSKGEVCITDSFR